ncbi:MAG TPA: CapA family protein [Thermoleophilaceae bacterium]|nr:CapA family protein [Thermoleophilaceae bacterium]
MALGALLAAWVALLVVLAPFVLAGGDAPSTARASAKPRPPADAISIAWAGDITPGSRYGNPPEGGRALFGEVRSLVSRADLAIGNLEGTLSVGGASKCGTDAGNCFSFQAPPANAAALRWAGFDLLNVANNHAFDFGQDGQHQTLAALSANRLAHTGRPGEITLLRRRGVQIAVVGFAPYPWASDLRNLSAVSDLVRRAAAQAQLVIVLAHLGGEGSDQTHIPDGREIAMGEDRGDTKAFARAAVDAGADLVLGSGPHVLRGIEFHRGKLIAYSLGNFAGWHNFSTSGSLALSGLLTVHLTPRGHLRGGKFTALRLDGAGAPSPDPSGEATALVNRLGGEDFGGSALRLMADGSF